MNRKKLDKMPWTNNVKIGDPIIVVTTSGSKRLDKVTGVSKKSIFIGNEQFSKFTGTMHSNKKVWLWLAVPKIEMVTQDVLNDFEKERLIMAECLQDFDFYTLSHKDLKSIYNTFNEILGRKVQ